MPSPNETAVLRIAQEVKRVNKHLISRRMGITSLYASNMLDTLTAKGHLENPARGKYGAYRLAPKGRRALSGARPLRLVGERELEVLKAVSDFKRASTNMLSRRLYISNDYALLMLKSLSGLNFRAPYLKRIGTYLYELKPLGQELLAKRKKIKRTKKERR